MDPMITNICSDYWVPSYQLIHSDLNNTMRKGLFRLRFEDEDPESGG